MRTIIIFVILITSWITCLGQDGSDMRYIPIQKLDKSFIGQFAHLDFYNRSYMGLKLDTVVIKIDNKSIKFIEHRQDDGFNNWFSQQYLSSSDTSDGYSIKIVKCKIDSIKRDSILVTNFLEYYDINGKIQPNKSRQQDYWFKREIIKEVLIKSKQL